MGNLQFNKGLMQFIAQLKENFKVLKKANVFMKEVDAYIMWSTWYQSIVNGLYSLGIFTIIGYTAQSTIASVTKSKNFTPGLFTICVLAYVVYQFAKVIVDSISKARQLNFDEKIETRFERKILEKCISLDTGRLTDPDFQDKNRHSGRYRSITQVFKYQTEFLSAVIGAVASFAIVAVINPFVLLIGFLPFIPETITLFILNKKRRELRDKRHLIDQRRDVYYHSLKNSHKLIQAKLFKFVPFLFGRFIETSEQVRVESKKINRREIKWKTLIESLKTVLSCIVLIYLGKGCLNGTVTFASLLMVVGSLKTLGSSMFRISNNFLHFQEDCKDYLEFESFLEVQPLIDEKNAHDIDLQEIPTMTLSNVSFSYPRNPERVVLENCNLQIFKSEKIAIVGRNGAGKSTILKLLAKVYLPTSGNVHINDINIESITQESWLNHLVYITQGASVNDMPLKEALTGSSDPDMNRLVEASKLAGTHELIMGRVKGYDLKIRTYWERGGEDFSGGEYQRLALVSVFYRLLDEKVFVGFFDEPMSNCDNETRNRFYKAINSIPNKTIVAVAHDHHYLHYFKRVIEIEGGCVHNDMQDLQSIIGYEEESSSREKVIIE